MKALRAAREGAGPTKNKEKTYIYDKNTPHITCDMH